MPFIVKELIEENPTVVVTTLDESVSDALVRMIENDFSQLPVVDRSNRPLGMVTSESILRSLTGFNVELNQLKVEHAYINAETFRADADLFDLLDRLQDTYAVIIVDGEDHLIGIVTNYDTAEYFRRRAEDIMLVEDIETMLKDYIQAAFIDEGGEIDAANLDEAVQQVTDTGKALRDQFERALIHYLTLRGSGGSPIRPNNEWLRQVYAEHYNDDNSTKNFDDLTLYEYIELLLDKSRWPNYRSVFHLERGAVRNLLNKVREIRNALAHFRGEISSAQRDHLRFSANWLAQYQDIAPPDSILAVELISMNVMAEPQQDYDVHVQDATKVNDVPFILPSDEEINPNESRYATLALWLQNQPSNKDSVQFTFEKIEEIIRGNLPKSAYAHRAWWANDSVGHVQSQQWLEVGWKVKSINMTDRLVIFSRIKERQKAYNHFFSELLEKLRQHPDLVSIEAKPASKFWQQIESISVSDKHFAIISFSFRRGGLFRIELYINAKEKDLNKRIFAGLFERREEIETYYGDKLIWQQLPQNRASRVATAHAGSITDRQDALEELQKWAVDNLAKFISAIRHPAKEEAKRAIARLNEA